MLPDHLTPLRRRIRRTRISPPPPPWRETIDAATGGLTEVGFGPGSDHLLVVSSTGRGVFDGPTGERVARDRTPPADWYDAHRLIARGIGPLEGVDVPIAGLHGGGLTTSTADLWWVESVPLAWPTEHLFLGGPGGRLHDPETELWKLDERISPRAFGFSSTGKTLVLATSSDVHLWSRF